MHDDTIAAIATAPGKGAVAIVRASGPDVAGLLRRFVRTKSPLCPRVATRASVLDERGRLLDRGIAIFFPAPASYTGEDVAELHVHGSPVVAREVVRALVAGGARHAQPGEFTRRAFLNGKIGLHEAEAVADIIDAETQSAARAALANLGGGLTSEIRRMRGALAAILEELAAAIDFPDEVPEPQRGDLTLRLGRLSHELEGLLRDGERGRLVREGTSAAIVGPPNAGKSSLLNALLGEDRAIVSEIPGTTRDVVEAAIAIDGVTVRLLDTAGIRAHADRLEAAGIERSRNALAAARVAVVVVDGSRPLGPAERDVLELTAGHARVVIANKSDLGTAGAAEIGDPSAIVGTVAAAATIRAVRAAIARMGWGGERPDVERPHLAALREFSAVAQARDALDAANHTLQAGDPVDLIAGELQRAFSALGHVTEPTAAEEVLTGIFARFCIGK